MCRRFEKLDGHSGKPINHPTGHLVLLLLRYLYEEKVLPMPAAAMLFSVSTSLPLPSLIIDPDALEAVGGHG
jgi:hypothetical protein